VMRTRFEIAGFKSISVFLFCLVFSFVQTLTVVIASAEYFPIVRIFEVAEVENDKIRLGDIAEIICDITEAQQTLSEVIIGKSPPPGRTRRIDEDYIKFRLKKSGIDLTRIALEVPKQIEVSRSYVEADKEMIKKTLLDFIDGYMLGRRATVNVKKIQIHSDLILPKGDITYSVIPPKDSAFSSPMPFSITLKVNGRAWKTVRAWVKLEILADVVVAQRPIGRYKPISKEDICMKKMNAVHLPSNTVMDFKEVIGKRARRHIDSQTVIRTDLIEYPPLVRRGDMVMIVAETEGLKITALGEVRNSGRRGEKVRVVNVDSHKSIFARVMDANTVKVEF
jgi:flagella basal body P-ring formation protein FlgA